MQHIGTCHRCPYRQKFCAGFCPCTVDGVDIMEHAQTGECPRGYFGNHEKMEAERASAPKQTADSQQVVSRSPRPPGLPPQPCNCGGKPGGGLRNI